MFEIRDTEEKLLVIRSGIGRVIGPLFFGWLPVLVLAIWAEQWFAAAAGTPDVKQPLLRVPIICGSALFICAWLWTIVHGLELNYSKRTITRATRQLGIWFGRPEPIPEGTSLRVDLCQGAVAEALSTNERNIYMRLVLIAEGEETVLIKKLATPPGSPAVTVSRELTALGERASSLLSIPLVNELRDDSHIRVVTPPPDGRNSEEMSVTRPRQKGAASAVLFFGMIFTGAGAHIANTDTLVVGLFFGCFGLVILFGAAWLQFRSYQVIIRPDLQQVEVRSGWRGAIESSTYRCDDEVRLVLHVSHRPENSVKWIYELGLAVSEEILSIPTKDRGFFDEIYPQAIGLSTRLGIPLELNGALTCGAQDKLLAEGQQDASEPAAP